MGILGGEEAVLPSRFCFWTRTSVSSARLAHAAEERLIRVRRLTVEMSGRSHAMDNGRETLRPWHGRQFFYQLNRQHKPTCTTVFFS